MIARVLPREEWDRVSEANGLPQIGPTMAPGDAQIVVVEDEGSIVATMAVLRVTHFESLWIAPAYRGHAGVGRALLREAVSAARASAPWAWGCSDTEHMRDVIERVGGVHLPVESYMIRLSEGA